MKKVRRASWHLAFVICFLILAGSGTVSSYTFFYNNTLIGTGGSAELGTGIWDPADSNSPLFGTGYWGYEYEVWNNGFINPILKLKENSPDDLEVLEWKTPAGWVFHRRPAVFDWDTAGAGIGFGETLGGFGVKSHLEPGQTTFAVEWYFLNAYSDQIYGPMVVPEPGTLSIFVSGLVFMSGIIFRERKKE